MGIGSTQSAPTGMLRLRQMTGDDERAVERADSVSAIDLVARLTGRDVSTTAAMHTAYQRDRILATIFTSLYGDLVESVLPCNACGKSFEITFSLKVLMEGQQPNPEFADLLEDGTYRLADGTRFRLPSGEDELAIMGFPPERALEELLRRCVIEAGHAVDADAIQNAMEQVAPILDLDIKTSCAECGAAATVRFDIQSYLLQSILRDRARLWRETHVLATSYKWSLNAIHRLTRADRRMLVSMIEADASRRRGI